ncbi:thiol:disulfide interchange protein DsbA/DsbL [Candidatus Vallotia cooleyia]|uniref:thiol:disulfide interchange protein DsbA/DsbL n=1 Tax=Candidatus Vallotiella adelgis TaxID=1177211 RepID=UPI001D02C957|nr:thiol:disulfide interchange protein DsbA/DsbL [Candidatus Vallotia cooleyia]UDG82558.1 Thiol:disulfide interchange protein DsbA [Candidatus Vallotia cooleyia]
MKKILSTALLAAAVELSLIPFTQAALPSEPVLGKDYIVLTAAHPVEVQGGKVEVIEFIWYGCLHCSEFDPYMERWKAQQGTNIIFRRVPVTFRSQFIPHSKMLLALNMLGLGDKLAPAIFNEIHIKQNYLLQPDAQADFLARQGVSKKKYLDTYNSFAVTRELSRASKMAQDYKISGVPTVVVQGKYETGPAATNSLEGTVHVLEYLVGQVAMQKM